MSRESYQVRWRGKVSGPYDSESLGSMLSRGEVSLFHEVLKDGRWIPLEELFPRAAAKPPLSKSSDQHPQQAGLITSREEKTATTKIAPPPVPNDQYYLAKGGQQEGPYSVSRLKDLATAQAVTPDDMVWKAGMPNWVVLSTIIGPSAFERAGRREGQSNAPASSQTEDAPPSGEKRFARPDCVTTAVILMFVAASLGLIRALIYFVAIGDAPPFNKPSAVGIFFCVLAAVFGFLFFLIAQAGNGRNWARVTVLVFYLVGIALLPFALEELAKLPAILLVMDGAVYLLNLLAMISVFMPDANRWFARVKVRRLEELIK